MWVGEGEGGEGGWERSRDRGKKGRENEKQKRMGGSREGGTEAK